MLVERQRGVARREGELWGGVSRASTVDQTVVHGVHSSLRRHLNYSTRYGENPIANAESKAK